MEGTLSNLEVALVSGGGRRIGAAIVRVLHEAGMRVAVHYHRSRAETETLCDELNARCAGSARAVSADLALPESAGALVDSTLRAFGRLDVVVNNASRFFPSPLGEIEPDSLEALFAVNTFAPLLVSQAAAPHLRAEGASIVNIGDIYAHRPVASHAAYCASKAALMNLTRSLAAALAPRVRVNAVAPGAILWPENEGDARARQRVIDDTLLGRIGHPDDVASAVRYLVRDAPFVTGQVIDVDGGRGLRGPHSAS